MRAILMFLAAGSMAGCAGETTTPSAPPDAFELPADQVASRIQLRMTNQGVVTAVLSADTAFTHENSRKLDMLGVQVDFKTETGSDAGTLTSRTADYDTSRKMFVARGTVVLVTRGPEGDRRLETEELNYDLNGDQIWTNQPFSLLEAGRTSRGSSFRTDSKFQVWETTGLQTHGTVPDDVEGGL
jgi:LPS export ABC transporter protein LptC